MQAELRKVLAAIGARVIDRELPVPPAQEAFDPRGAPVDREQQALLANRFGASQGDSWVFEGEVRVGFANTAGALPAR